MVIATTLGALVQAEAALGPICALKLSAKSAYHLKKLTQLVAIETKHFHTERDALIRDLGTATDDGSFVIEPNTEAFASFVTKATELAAVPVEIPWGPVTLEMLGDSPISAGELRALGPLFEDREAAS